MLLSSNHKYLILVLWDVLALASPQTSRSESCAIGVCSCKVQDKGDISGEPRLPADRAYAEQLPDSQEADQHPLKIIKGALCLTSAFSRKVSRGEMGCCGKSQRPSNMKLSFLNICGI